MVLFPQKSPSPSPSRPPCHPCPHPLRPLNPLSPSSSPLSSKARAHSRPSNSHTVRFMRARSLTVVSWRATGGRMRPQLMAAVMAPGTLEYSLALMEMPTLLLTRHLTIRSTLSRIWPHTLPLLSPNRTFLATFCPSRKSLMEARRLNWTTLGPTRLVPLWPPSTPAEGSCHSRTLRPPSRLTRWRRSSRWRRSRVRLLPPRQTPAPWWGGPRRRAQNRSQRGECPWETVWCLTQPRPTLTRDWSTPLPFWEVKPSPTGKVLTLPTLNYLWGLSPAHLPPKCTYPAKIQTKHLHLSNFPHYQGVLRPILHRAHL